MNDVIIVGAGPAGLHLAYRLATAGLAAVVVDAQNHVGEHAVCAGVIGEEAFERFALPTRSVVTKIHAIRAISPGGQILEHRSALPLARVVNKGEFNRDMAILCRIAGVKFLLGRYAESVLPQTHGVAVACRSRSGEKEMLDGRVAVIASGANASLTKRLGMVGPREFLRAVQADVVVGGDGAALPTDIYVGREIAPGGFAWKIPLGHGCYRLGLMSTGAAKPFYAPFLQRAAPQVAAPSVRPLAKAIAQVPSGNSVAERLLVIGEAAGHVKTSTGGGIYYGFLSAELASHVLRNAFRRGQFSRAALADYERYCHSAFGNEIFYGYLARKLLSRLPDFLIEKAFAKARGADFFAKLNGSLKFDWHQKAILTGIRTLFDFA